MSKKKLIGNLITLAIISTCLFCEKTMALTYYVSCDTGDNGNGGLSEIDAWRSPEALTKNYFIDGDEILFKRGCKWENVSIKIKKSLIFDSYGDEKSLPELSAGRYIKTWQKNNQTKIYYTTLQMEQDVPASKDIYIVYDEINNTFYTKAGSISELNKPGTFYYDIDNLLIYVYPNENLNVKSDLMVSSKHTIFEIQQNSIEHLSIKNLHLSFANLYAIGFFYQSSGTKNGSLDIENNYFFGNAYQALHVAGTNSFIDIEFSNNTITANGNEAVYIGFIKGNIEGVIVHNQLRIVGNTIGGNDYGWRSLGNQSAANGDGLDIKRGVNSVVIENNTISDIQGNHGILTQSSNAIIRANNITNVRMERADFETSISGIIVDAYDKYGTTIVTNNSINLEQANGIVIRGHAQLKPKTIIFGNDITVSGSYFPIAFTSQNITNTNITNNIIKGGKASVLIMRACCTPSEVTIQDNQIRNVKQIIISKQEKLSGIKFDTNVICIKNAYKPEEVHNRALEKQFAQRNVVTECY